MQSTYERTQGQFHPQSFEQQTYIHEEDPYNKNNNRNNEEPKNKQQTLFGVIIPVISNILGVLLFIRLPQITGEAGILDTSIIVTLCIMTSLITIISLNHIIKNQKNTQYGTIYTLIQNNLQSSIISKATGFFLYLGTALTGVMNLLAFSEQFIKHTGYIFYSPETDTIIYSILLLILFTIITTTIGQSFTTKTYIMIFFILFLAIQGLYIGLLTLNAREIEKLGHQGMSWENLHNNWDPMYGKNNDIYSSFALYFPIFAGIIVGYNRANMLKTPSKSLPKGTIGGSISSSIIQLTLVILFGSVCDRMILLNNQFSIAVEVSWPTTYIIIVVIQLCSLQSSMSAIEESNLILRDIAEDSDFFLIRFFKGKKSAILTFIICLYAIITMKNIEMINPIITIIFLISFQLLCISSILISIKQHTQTYISVISSFIGVCICFSLIAAISQYVFFVYFIFLAILLVTWATFNSSNNKKYKKLD